MALLEVEDLTVSFAGSGRRVTVLDGVSFTLDAGEIVGLVGESGCGKSITAMSVMRLLPSPPSRVDRGGVRFAGTDLLSLPERRMRAMRGNRIGMIFQEPMTSLNPTFTVGWQIDEALRLHTGLNAEQRRARCLELMGLVGVGAAERRLGQYPHELSGGLRQRVMIAMALACGPEMIIADEPTTALDVTIQAQILDLLVTLRRDLGTAILMITHDLGVVAEYCDRVVVMYAGKVVEKAPVESLFARPRHPYTTGLLASMPRLDSGRGPLASIPGMVPSPGSRPPGCPFADRCPNVLPRCAPEMPPLETGPDGHAFACWNPMP
ncbi:ABC transporter ATP-binding protein [Azospirillum sp. SYSU D00513]|uniref:ABC transporter ATP-binding protein n=1 Tax=Azospirillum sp. SYSU D00513 TaxID=2812561 RepID=UPI001A961F1B|nr:ABC transporter ATP-binding protein [Azospirillum sp. SYSU D00513]